MQYGDSQLFDSSHLTHRSQSIDNLAKNSNRPVVEGSGPFSCFLSIDRLGIHVTSSLHIINDVFSFLSNPSG
jgi:hypothetical protein